MSETGEAQQPPAWPAYVGATARFDIGRAPRVAFIPICRTSNRTSCAKGFSLFSWSTARCPKEIARRKRWQPGATTRS